MLCSGLSTVTILLGRPGMPGLAAFSSEPPKLMGRVPVRSHLVHALVQLDRDYLASGSRSPWESLVRQRD